MKSRSLMFHAACVCATAIVSASPVAIAATPVDRQIVRVVYEIESDGPRGTWGFHLAHMPDGRYCVRLGNPGRLNLAIIQRVADICFAGIPASVGQTAGTTAQSLDARGGRVSVTSRQSGSIESTDNGLALNITTCNRTDRDQGERCFPHRFVISFDGQGCSAQVTLSGANRRAGQITCERYAAR